MVSMNRRQFLQFALALSASSGLSPLCSLAAGASAPRWVILDWGLTEMALALGVVPVGVAAPQWYRRLYSEPALPADVADVGLLFQPNFETLRELRPTLLLVTPGHLMAKAQLEQIAPLLVLNTYSNSPLEQAQANLRQMAGALGQPERAEQIIAAVNARMEKARLAVQPFADTPLYLAHPLEILHLYLFGKGSLFDDVLTRLGLKNASQLATSAQGLAMTSVDQLAAGGRGRVVLLPSYPQPDISDITGSALWRSLPLLQPENCITLPDGLPQNGALITAVRFAESLAQGLQQRGRA